MIEVQGQRVPGVMYGTAWKEDATEELVAAALAAGFRAIDTANQRKHYYEEGVGRALARSGIPRDELFIQTKFTHRDGQDHRLPYDEHAPIATQVAQSFDSSLVHLGVERIDSLVLHGPSERDGLGAEDLDVWRAMEAIARSGRVRVLGASNVTARQVAELVETARVPPAFVQNRCYASRGWDAEVRAVCAQHAIIYQGFSLLTANRGVVEGPVIGDLARRHGKTRAQIVLRFAQQLGMLPLTGTRDPQHMRDDLALEAFTLAPADAAAVERALTQ
jgi:diketogulonate reductase-like aldo/keto reductase